MKWFKRLLLLGVFVVVFGLGLLAIGFYLSRGTPAWYVRGHRNPTQMAAAAARAEDQIIRVKNWANRDGLDRRPATQPASQSHTISFTEDELNALFQKWDATFGWSAHYAQYLSDPQIVLQDDRLILAANVKDLGTVMSTELAPRVEGGKLHMTVTRVMAGRLPLPQSFWDKYRQELENYLRQLLPVWQQGARLGADGTANSDAVDAAMAELLLAVMNNRPAQPVLFLPYSIWAGNKSVAVKLQQVQISDKLLTIQVVPMTRTERQSLLSEIRSNQSEAAGMSDSSAPDPPAAQ